MNPRGGVRGVPRVNCEMQITIHTRYTRVSPTIIRPDVLGGEPSPYFGHKYTLFRACRFPYGYDVFLHRSANGEATTLVLEPDLIQGAVASMGSGTSPWGVGAALWGVVPLWRASPPPQTLLADRRPQPADCWPFSGSRGEVVIELPGQHRVRRISIQHVRPDAARSAPRHFSLYGISENGTWKKGLSGEYTYDGPAKQYFSVLHELPHVNRVVLRVLSNHGNTKYTCIYRVHIYGSLNII